MGTDQDVLVAQDGERWRWIQTWMSWLHREVDTDLDVLVAQGGERWRWIQTRMCWLHRVVRGGGGYRPGCAGCTGW